MPIYEFEDVSPSVPDTAWIADSAQVIGRVHLGDQVSVWFGAVIRGDNEEPVRIGRGTNIQDLCVLHADPGQPLSIGERVTVGHRVILHGCSIGDGSLIGMGAVVLNGVKIGRNCLVGAGALVTENKEFPDGSMIVGSPAVLKRALSAEQIAGLAFAADHYIDNARRFCRTLRRVDRG